MLWNLDVYVLTGMQLYLVDFSPESVFETFFGFIERLRVLEGVQMCEHPHDPRETVDLTDVEELKRLHFKTKTSIYQHQNLVKRKTYIVHIL